MDTKVALGKILFPYDVVRPIYDTWSISFGLNDMALKDDIKRVKVVTFPQYQGIGPIGL